MYDLGSTVYAYFSPISVTSDAGMQLMVAPRAHGKVELCSRIETLRMTPFRMVLTASAGKMHQNKTHKSKHQNRTKSPTQPLTRRVHVRAHRRAKDIGLLPGHRLPHGGLGASQRQVREAPRDLNAQGALNDLVAERPLSALGGVSRLDSKRIR